MNRPFLSNHLLYITNIELLIIVEIRREGNPARWELGEARGNRILLRKLAQTVQNIIRSLGDIRPEGNRKSVDLGGLRRYLIHDILLGIFLDRHGVDRTDGLQLGRRVSHPLRIVRRLPVAEYDAGRLDPRSPVLRQDVRPYGVQGAGDVRILVDVCDSQGIADVRLRVDAGVLRQVELDHRVPGERDECHTDAVVLEVQSVDYSVHEVHLDVVSAELQASGYVGDEDHIQFDCTSYSGNRTNTTI